MAIRVGFDIDGVVADFRTAFEREARHHMTGPLDPDRAETDALSNEEMRRIWARIMNTPNWWTTVAPFERDQITRLFTLARQLKWEVVFMTKRPATSGEPVQFQTQHWLEQQGFHYPAVVTVPGSRGELVNALRLDVVVDDQLFNCVDIVTGSHAKALLLLREAAPDVEERATSRGIGVVRTLAHAIDSIASLERAQAERKGRLQRLGDWFVPRPASAFDATPDPQRVRLKGDSSGDG